MRKDFIEDAQNDSEIDFVERFWTAQWDALGGPKGAADRIARKEERRVMARHLHRLPDGARLLDGGCGLGDWVLHFTRAGYPTLGLDISRKTIDALQSRFPEAEFAVGDIRATGLADASVDGYFSWGTFEHFEEGLEPCVREAFRVLKPGGLLFTSVPFDNLRMALRAAAVWRGRSAPETRSMRFYQWRLSRGEFRDLLSRAGFETLEIKSIGKRQGVQRSLQHEIGMNYDWTLTKGLSVLLAPFVPAGIFAHMLLAVARKPLGAQDIDAGPCGERMHSPLRHNRGKKL